VPAGRPQRSSMIFIGYGGGEGKEIAEDVCLWFQRKGFDALTVAGEIEDSIPFLESQETILQALPKFDLAVMVCTRGAVHSRRFRDETEKLVYDLEKPTIAFVMRGAPLLNTLRLRTRVYFARNHHRNAFGDLFSVVNKLLADHKQTRRLVRGTSDTGYA